MSSPYWKWLGVCSRAKRQGIEFKLTLDDYIKLMSEAGITYDQVGPAGYHLARYNDTGPYAMGNCRFIWYLQNLQEKKISDLQRETSSRNGKCYGVTQLSHSKLSNNAKKGNHKRYHQGIPFETCKICNKEISNGI